MRKTYFHLLLLLAVAVFLVLPSCSHNYDPDTLDLGFYQWNFWYDTSAEAPGREPSCGWEDLHRGMGKLVRIPALASDHFKKKQDHGVLWYHCRFTLPENWEDRMISLVIRGAAPAVRLFLNEQQIAAYQGEDETFEMDVSDMIYYTRDNHLAIEIGTLSGKAWSGEGISGGVSVQSMAPCEQESPSGKK